MRSSIRRKFTMIVMTLCFALMFVVTGYGSEGETKIFYGEPTPVGNGVARAYVTLDNTGKPTTVGLVISATALSGLSPDPMPVEYRLSLPKEAAATPFNHIGLDWNAKGHEPAGIYDKPHFDVHFYMISYEDRLKIAPNDQKFDNLPSAEYLPEGYQRGPGGVPQMGVHWIDVSSSELHGQPFTITFIYGTYDGAVTFLEPMITVAFLETKPNFIADIKQPRAYPKPGFYYPLKYSVRYDATTQEYRIGLDDLVLR
jgi:hypothetical protein